MSIFTSLFRSRDKPVNRTVGGGNYSFFMGGTTSGKVYREAVELCVYLCQQFDLTEKDIICHSEGHARGIASNHADVMHWFTKFGKNMDTFRAEVKAELELEETVKLDNTAADWSKDSVNWAIRNGLLKGDEKGDLMLHSPVTREQFCVILKRFMEVI